MWGMAPWPHCLTSHSSAFSNVRIILANLLHPLKYRLLLDCESLALSPVDTAYLQS